MTEYTRPATWEDVVQVARYLNEAGVEYALVGGYALIGHGLNRASEDIDILVDPSRENGEPVDHRALPSAGRAARELSGETDLLAKDPRYGIRINDEITVDVLGSACGHSWDELKVYRTSLTRDGVTIFLLDLEGLLLTKGGLRERDKMDAMILRLAIEHLSKD